MILQIILKGFLFITIMPCTVYILFSETRGHYYAGISNDLSDRIRRHNNGESLSTKSGVPWKLIYSVECIDKSSAMSLEKKIKGRGIRRYLFDINILPGI